MPRINVNGVNLAYEIFGEGPPIVWTPGGWSPRDDFVYLHAKRLSPNYKVLLWDRRNCGASDLAIEDAPSEYYLWSDDLHHLLNALNMSPAYVAGGSAGHIVSLLMAHRYPQDVKGLILFDVPADDPNLRKPIVDARFLQLAEVAEKKGMEAVIDHPTEAIYDWFRVAIVLNPSNRDRLLSMDAKEFARIMRRWAECYQSWRFHLAGLSDEELRGIRAPAIILHGFNEGHPRHTAEELHKLLPNSQWAEYSDRHTQEEIDQMGRWDVSLTQLVDMVIPFYEEFLQKNESK